jgi:hypothetical protein
MCVMLACLLSIAVSAVAAPAAGFVINEDDSHFFGARPPEAMTQEGLFAFVDQYAGTKVSHLFLCPNCMRTSYKSNVFDAIWDVGSQVVPEDQPFAKQWVANARLLNERGLDPYAVWIQRAREKGISPWLSMRMNDVHNVDHPEYYIHSRFWVDHPDYWRVPGGAGWTDRAFDYGIAEVRDYHKRLVQELLERYDADGIELDWMRFGYHFKPGQEKQGAEILTQFMREVRALAQEWSAKRGHPIKIGARVPAHPDAAVGLGMDGITWVREGLVDMLVPTPFWATADFDIPMEMWRERIGPACANITLAAGMEILLRAYPDAQAVEADLTAVRGFAATALQRGADQVYLFNYMDPAPMTGGPEAYRALLEKGLALDVVTKEPRRHIVTYRDTVPEGVSNNVRLPVEGPVGATLQIHTGPAAPKTGKVSLVAGLAQRDGMAEAVFDTVLNGKAGLAAADVAAPEQFPGAVRAVVFEWPAEVSRDGYNDVSIKQREGQPAQQVVWLELRVEPGP